ncbi:hypothetical protein BC937DRAFT_93728 [Endogone sp. FLAS-F59071]|nr:hypothetical protein BC937DRAFT_93728 [Endogone sp. FLAS-F59071]|eukprot:RUS14498.1 hypothetical protein BC937DRAFT_93728 [Endogone sp. FLAS-F59071]
MNQNENEPSTPPKSSATVFPIEILRNILWLLSSTDLWPLRLVDKLLYENVMEMVVRRIEYAFTKDGWVLKFEANATYAPDNFISLLCTFLHIDPKTQTTYFEFSGPTPEHGAIPTMPCSPSSRTLFLPAQSQVIAASTDLLRVHRDTGAILQTFPVNDDETTVLVEDAEVTIRMSNSVIEIETIGQVTDEEALKQSLGQKAGLKVEFKRIGLRAEYLLELLEAWRNDQLVGSRSIFESQIF